MTGVAVAEELLLLAYDDESGKATMPRISLDLGMAAAVLVELALAGRIAYVDGNLAVTDPTPVGEPILDGVLGRMAADTPHSPSSWVQRLRHGLRDRILGDLVDRGVVRDVEETELGFIVVHRYPTTDPSVEQDSRRRLAEALAGEQLPDERTAALATLVAVLRMEPALGLDGTAARTPAVGWRRSPAGPASPARSAWRSRWSAPRSPWWSPPSARPSTMRSASAPSDPARRHRTRPRLAAREPRSFLVVVAPTRSDATTTRKLVIMPGGVRDGVVRWRGQRRSRCAGR